MITIDCQTNGMPRNDDDDQVCTSGYEPFEIIRGPSHDGMVFVKVPGCHVPQRCADAPRQRSDKKGSISTGPGL